MSQSFEFPDGSSLRWVDRETLRYKKGAFEVSIWVDFEPGFFSRGRILRSSSLTEWSAFPSGTAEEISNSDKEDIINKAIEYYQRQKRKCSVQD